MRKHVLLIDDSVTIHKIVELTIDRLIFELHGAYDMEDGIRLTKGTGADIILVDNKLCAGDDCMQRLRAAAPRAAIVMLVGAYDQFLDTDVKHLNVQDYLVKPFSSATLNQALTDAITQDEEPIASPTDKVDKPDELPKATLPEPAEEPQDMPFATIDDISDDVSDEEIPEEISDISDEPDASPAELIEQDIELEMLENHLQNMNYEEEAEEPIVEDIVTDIPEEPVVDDIVTDIPEEPVEEQELEEPMLMLTESPVKPEALPVPSEPEEPELEPEELPQEIIPVTEIIEPVEEPLPEPLPEPEEIEPEPLPEDMTPLMEVFTKQELEPEEEIEPEPEPEEEIEPELEPGSEVGMTEEEPLLEEESLPEEDVSEEEDVPEEKPILDTEEQNQLIDDLYNLLNDDQPQVDLESADKLFAQEVSERSEIMDMFGSIDDKLDDITGMDVPPVPDEPEPAHQSGFMRIAKLNETPKEKAAKLTIEFSTDELAKLLKNYLDNSDMESIVGKAMQKAMDRVMPELVEKLVQEELKRIK